MTEAQKNENPVNETPENAAPENEQGDTAPTAAQTGAPVEPDDEQPSGVAAAKAGIESADVAGGEAPMENFTPSFELGGESAGEADSRIAMLETELADMKDKMLRAVAEQENVRRRAQKDIESARTRAVKSIAADLLAVADNLRRALDSIDEAVRKDNPAVENVLIGVEMTERELMTAFGRHGITRIQPVGQPFDPHFHEAMFEIPDETQPAGTVGQVIETGYAINGQPLRAAKVGVTKGGPKREAASQASESAAGASVKAAKPDAAAEPGAHIDENL